MIQDIWFNIMANWFIEFVFGFQWICEDIDYRITEYKLFHN